MITRDDACSVLYSIINSGLFSEELDADLEEIANCISCEKDSLHMWGCEDQDMTDLYVCVRDDLVTPEYEAHVDKLFDTYRFYASKFESKEIEPDDEEEDKEGENK